MKQSEKTLREKAAEFADAVDKAKEDGFYFPWPQNLNELRSIAISETSRVEPEPKKSK